MILFMFGRTQGVQIELTQSDASLDSWPDSDGWLEPLNPLLDNGLTCLMLGRG